MNDLAIARAVHVLAVVIWIGGVGMVTTVILPVVRARMPTEGQALLEAVERRFIGQALQRSWWLPAASIWWNGSIFGIAFVTLSSGGCTPWFCYG